MLPDKDVMYLVFLAIVYQNTPFCDLVYLHIISCYIVVFSKRNGR